MRDRLKNLKRIVEVQRHLHGMEELKYARLKQAVVQCQGEQRALSEALSSDDALHGLFMDVTVKRIKSLQQEEAKLEPQLDAQVRALTASGGRLRNSERLAEELTVEVRREEERLELERLLEVGLAVDRASSEQDQ